MYSTDFRAAKSRPTQSGPLYSRFDSEDTGRRHNGPRVGRCFQTSPRRRAAADLVIASPERVNDPISVGSPREPSRLPTSSVEAGMSAILSVERAWWGQSFKVAFLESKGASFQALVRRLLSLRFPSEYVTVKPAGRDGDWKNDGLLRDRRQLLQVYAPDGFDKTTTLKKIAADFDGAVEHWSDLFDEWVLVHNSVEGLPPYATKDLETRTADDGRITCDQWTYPHLRAFAFELTDSDLLELLGPPMQLRDFLDVEVQDVVPLVKAIEGLPTTPLEEVRPVPPDKLHLNGLSTDAELLLLHGMHRADAVSKYFDGQTQRVTFRDDLGARFKAKYVELRDTGLDPDLILDGLLAWIVGPLPSSRERAAGLAVIAFFFEQCDIFEVPVAPEESA